MTSYLYNTEAFAEAFFKVTSLALLLRMALQKSPEDSLSQKPLLV